MRALGVGMNPEIYWKSERKAEFLDDLKSFAQELDCYELSFDLEKEKSKFISIENGKYKILEKD